MLYCINVNSCTGLIGIFLKKKKKLLYESIGISVFSKCSFSFMSPLVELVVDTLHYYFSRNSFSIYHMSNLVKLLDLCM